jgi:type VI secretion system protein ImpA
MPSDSVIDVASLIDPISGDNPAGAPLPYDVRLKLEELRKEIDPADYDADDPRRPTEYRKPDWKAIIRLAEDTLRGSSKDLLVAARLVEAATIEHGFAGLRDGLDLLDQLAETAWDRLHPQLQDGDTAEVREGPYKWLNQNDAGARFPHTLRQTPFLTVDGRGFSLLDWQQSDRRPAFEAAVSGATTEQIQNVLDDLETAKAKLQHLSDVLHEKMGEFVPDLVSSENTEHVGAAVNECLKLAKQLLQRKAGAAPADDGAAADGGATGGGAPMTRVLASRADAYRMLNQAADLLQQLEPHSPIPYLVKRAVKLGDMKFPDLMKALLRENAALDELYRFTGVEPPPPPPA